MPPVDRRTLRTPDPYVQCKLNIFIDLTLAVTPLVSGIGSVLEPEGQMFRSGTMIVECELKLRFIDAIRGVKLHSLDALTGHFLTHSSCLLRCNDEIDISK